MDKKRLDYFFDLLNSTVLSRQNTLTGLIPSCVDSSHAWVRDNTYASLCIWGLSLAYKKLPDLDEDRSRGYELGQCAVKLMRGILVCYMKQSSKVETLKKFQDPIHSLHAKFDANTCRTVVGDDQWGHLQIDAVSLYLLTLAQMTASGLRIVWTCEEVAFIQNLVFYIEHAHRIPDYGIWERGDKTNRGLPELNTSSVGMAKAALEALSDLDLFGADGSSLSTIHVFPDEVQQCNTVLESVLPRESNSKEIDASLLSILTYPGFAVVDEQLIKRTRTNIIQKLLGRYGCRRFIRDGFRTAREDSNRLYYEPWELRLFEGIECEWPMFLAWFVLDACFRQDYDDADHYMKMLQDVVVRETTTSVEGPASFEKPASRRTSEITSSSTLSAPVLMPETYAVPADRIDAELSSPHSQDRIPMGTLPHIWGQSLYILASIIYENILLPGEIDPLGRRLLSAPKPDLSVQVVLVAEDEAMKRSMQEFLFDLQTFEEIYSEAGIHIYPAKVLGQLYKQLGVCEKLFLSGRLDKDVGILSTSQFYRLTNQTVAFIPQFFDYHAFYMNLDVNFLIDCFRTCVAFLKRAWTSPGRPLLIFPIYHRFFGSAKCAPPALVSTIKKMATGYINGTRVTLGTLKMFEETSSLKQLDFVGSTDFLANAADLFPPHLQRRRLTPTPKVDLSDGGEEHYPSLGLARSTSPAATSGSSAGLAYEQDSFQRFSMRRKSMALAHAVTMDLTSQERENVPFDEAGLASFLATDVDDTVRDLSPHILRQRAEDDDLTCSASKLALKRMLNPELDPNEPQPNRGGLHLQLHGTSAFQSSRLRPPQSPSELSVCQPPSGNRTPTDRSRRTSDIGASGLPPSDWIASLSAEQLVTRLTHTDNLAEQTELLGRLCQLQGLDWDTGIDPTQPANVGTLLKEVYERAVQVTSWFLLRYTTALLGKRAASLAIALADVLVLQKQVTVGLPPEPREKVIDSPLPPQQLSELIQKACGEDILMSVVTQITKRGPNTPHEISTPAEIQCPTELEHCRQTLLERGTPEPPSWHHEEVVLQVSQQEENQLAYKRLDLKLREILIYLSMVARTKPQQLANILRLRIGLIIQMMGAELARTMCLSAEDSLYALFSMSPFDMKRLLLNLLSGEEIRIFKSARTIRRKSTNVRATHEALKSHQSTLSRRTSMNQRSILSRLPSLGGMSVVEEAREVRGMEMRNLWSRRRKIDGALNRVPPGFYKRVYIALSRISSLQIGAHVLSSSLTTEMTMEEHKFALAVERVNTMVSTPEFRQLLVEATHVLGTLLMYDVTNCVHLDCIVKIDDIVEIANTLFLLDQVKYDANATLCCARVMKDQNITDFSVAAGLRKPVPLLCHGPHGICQHFYDTPPAGRFGTMSYMVRAVSHLLQSFEPLKQRGLSSVDCNVQ